MPGYRQPRADPIGPSEDSLAAAIDRAAGLLRRARARIVALYPELRITPDEQTAILRAVLARPEHPVPIHIPSFLWKLRASYRPGAGPLQVPRTRGPTRLAGGSRKR